MILLLCLGFTYSPTGRAAEQGVHKMSYDVYASGFHVVQADLLIDKSEAGRYSILLDAHTRGFLGKLAPWRGSFETYGWVLNGADYTNYQPELHRSVSNWRGEQEVKSYHYAKDGSFKSLEIDEHDKPLETSIPEPELTQDTIDALTAALAVMDEVSAGRDCTGNSDVFDGKRRFEQVFAQEDVTLLNASKYNIYEGPAAECIVEVIPIAGAWHNKPRGWLSIQEQGRAKGTMPTVWIGSMGEGAPAIPVKIRVKTDYGTLMMHLTGYESGGDIYLAEKRREDDG